MQSIRYAIISKGDLLFLWGINETQLNRWIANGCPRRKDGYFLLSGVIRWHKKFVWEETRQKFLTSSITQRDLAKLAGVSRQTLFHWVKAGLPVNDDKSYDLVKVLHWLPKYYNKVYQEKHRRIARKMSEVVEDYRRKKCEAAPHLSLSHGVSPFQ